MRSEERMVKDGEGLGRPTRRQGPNALDRRIVEAKRGKPAARAGSTKAFKIHRLLELLQKSEAGLSLQQMAVSLGVNERTVKRYLAELRKWNCGLVFHQEGSNKKSFYTIQARGGLPRQFLPTLRQIRQELHAGGNPKYTQAITALIALLEEKDADPRELARTHADAYYIDHGPFAEADPPPGILKILENAILGNQVVRIRYSGYSGEGSEFEFQPYRLCLRVGTLYLIGRPHAEKGPFKSLVVKRIRRCMATPGRFARDPGFRIEEYYQYCFGQWLRQPGESPETVQLMLRSPWLEKYLSESRFNPPGRLMKRGGATFFEVKVLLKPDFVNWVLSLVPDLVPAQPAALRRKVRERLEAGLALLQGRPASGQ